MFEDDMLTFNPKDARAIEANLKASGYVSEKPIDSADGPCSVTLRDPDGRTVFLDQF
jgi:hypothetical protein